MKTYLVGGAVRDKLLDYPCHERDWVVVGATAQQLLAQGYQAVGKDFPVFLHPQSKEEYALARTERKTTPGHTGFDCFASPDVSLEQDLQRRDLTINAMAEDEHGVIIDPYGGQQDLKDRLLRHVSAAFIEDPLRVLRVARFCARYHHLGFTVAEETLNLMQRIAHSGELNTLAAERVWKELARSLEEKSPQQFFTILEQCEALQQLLPELCNLSVTSLDALAAASQQQAPTLIRFALLFADINHHHTEQLCQRIKVPKDFFELACLVSIYGKQLQEKLHSADQILQLLQQTDAFRRPQRFKNFVHCCELLFDSSHNSALLQKALDGCTAIDAGTIAANHLKGTAIAEEINRQRLLIINKQLQGQP